MYDYNKSNQVAYDPQGFCLPPGGPRMFGTPYPANSSKTEIVSS